MHNFSVMVLPLPGLRILPSIQLAVAHRPIRLTAGLLDAITAQHSYTGLPRFRTNLHPLFFIISCVYLSSYSPNLPLPTSIQVCQYLVFFMSGKPIPWNLFLICSLLSNSEYPYRVECLDDNEQSVVKDVERGGRGLVRCEVLLSRHLAGGTGENCGEP
jgi:hypothetical protein